MCRHINGLPSGVRKRRQRPATLSADSLHRGLVAAIHVRALVAINLDGDEMFVHDAAISGLSLGLAVHHVAPMAPHRADIEQNGFVLALRGFNAFAPHSCQRMGWCMAERRYDEDAWASELVATSGICLV